LQRLEMRVQCFVAVQNVYTLTTNTHKIISGPSDTITASDKKKETIVNLQKKHLHSQTHTHIWATPSASLHCGRATRLRHLPQFDSIRAR
jgi:hypothetical protein